MRSRHPEGRAVTQGVEITVWKRQLLSVPWAALFSTATMWKHLTWPSAEEWRRTMRCLSSAGHHSTFKKKETQPRHAGGCQQLPYRTLCILSCPNGPKAEAGGFPRARGQSGLCSKFKTNLNHTGRPLLRTLPPKEKIWVILRKNTKQERIPVSHAWQKAMGKQRKEWI